MTGNPDMVLTVIVLRDNDGSESLAGRGNLRHGGPRPASESLPRPALDLNLFIPLHISSR
jgi:hypothetical protein